MDWLALRSDSNSAWSEAGRGGGEGRSKFLREARRVEMVASVRDDSARIAPARVDGMMWVSMMDDLRDRWDSKWMDGSQSVTEGKVIACSEICRNGA